MSVGMVGWSSAAARPALRQGWPTRQASAGGAQRQQRRRRRQRPLRTSRPLEPCIWIDPSIVVAVLPLPRASTCRVGLAEAPSSERTPLPRLTQRQQLRLGSRGPTAASQPVPSAAAAAAAADGRHAQPDGARAARLVSCLWRIVLTERKPGKQQCGFDGVALPPAAGSTPWCTAMPRWPAACWRAAVQTS